MDKHQLKGLFYNCDEKYFLGNKCKEQKLFMAISEYVTDEDVTVALVEEPSLPDATKDLTDPHEFELLISLCELTRFSAPQTLKLISYINNRKVIIPVESGRTHNFLFIIPLARKPISIFVLSIIFKS
jgi:putative heme degradation protein